MEWLAESGYHPITPEDLYAYLAGAQGLPSKPVILTFDDGYADFYTTALPILRSHDFRAVSYVVSGFVGVAGDITPGPGSEGDRSGIQIGAHNRHNANTAQPFPRCAGGTENQIHTFIVPIGWNTA